MTGSWTRTLAVLAILVAIAAVISGLAYSGRLGDLRYANIPGIHPYPPAGMAFNPFNPTDKGDLINVAEAGKARADLLADGKVQIDAFAHGQTDPLSQAETGQALARSIQVVIDNNHAGFFEQGSTQLIRVQVGHLADPNDASIIWCVEERGISTLTFVAQTTGQMERQQSFRFDGKFWMVKVNGRYLIADEAVQRLS